MPHIGNDTITSDDFAEVAFSGDYNDLINKPAAQTVPAAIDFTTVLQTYSVGSDTTGPVTAISHDGVMVASLGASDQSSRRAEIKIDGVTVAYWCSTYGGTIYSILNVKAGQTIQGLCSRYCSVNATIYGKK